MEKKIGVFVCECGPNIKEALDTGTLTAYAAALPGVAHARSFHLYCAQEGTDLIENDIKAFGLTHLVVAACSPREHELTFRKAAERAGLNPYLVQIANIREHCAWVIKDFQKATAFSKSIVAAAVARVSRQDPLVQREIETVADVLVVGAGAAGLSAALTLAQKGRKVYLVEKTAAVGGQVVQYGELAPRLECAPCVLQPILDSALNHERIEVLIHAEVERLVGDYGNYTATVRRKATYVDAQACIGCDACLEPCPVDVPVQGHHLGEMRKAIYHPFRGALPNVPLIDTQHCLRFSGDSCTVCQEACPFGAINYEDSDQCRELSIGASVLATGFKPFDATRAPQFGYKRVPEVYTSLDLELMLSKNGCTEGEVRLKDGSKPRNVAIIHCVGSLDPRFNDYCSMVCCLGSMKIAHLLREQLPACKITAVCKDLCIPDKGGQELLREVQQHDRVRFVRLKHLDQVTVEEQEGRAVVKSEELETRGVQLEPFDMVVLAIGMEGGSDAGKLAELFSVKTGPGNFYAEAHGKLDPAGTISAGVTIAGCGQWPKNIEGSVAQAQAAAGKILSSLVPGEKIALDPAIATIAEEACSGCKMCIGLCPYHAITYVSDRDKAQIADTLCRGCGVCAASCPSQAITANHFTDSQLLAEMRAYLEQ